MDANVSGKRQMSSIFSHKSKVRLVIITKAAVTILPNMIGLKMTSIANTSSATIMKNISRRTTDLLQDRSFKK